MTCSNYLLLSGIRQLGAKINSNSVMTSLSQAKLLTQILNLESVRVTKYRNLSGIGLIIHLEALTKKASCDRCGQASHQVHQNHRYLVQGKRKKNKAVICY